MTEAPSISVVMPVYNGERFVAEAIESVLRQTLPDFEFIIVDDGSSDGTSEILQAFQARDARLRVHRQPRNLGFGAALNQGCRMARAEFIARLDADDVCLPARFEKQLAYLRAHPDVGVLGSAVQLIDQASQPGRIKSYPVQPGLVAWSMLFFNSLAHPSVMLRRSVLEARGFYPSGCRGGTEDFALFLGLITKTKLANVPDVLLRYRTWPGNMSKTSEQAQQDDAVRILREAVAEYWQLDLSAAEGLALMNLPRGVYPTSVDQIRLAGRNIPGLARLFLADPRWSREDAEAVRRDAGVKLLMLAALAVRRSPVLAASLIGSALRMSSGSVGAFGLKVLGTLRQR